MGYAISFAQQKGGAGKTTVLTHLAHALALDGAQIALLDLDDQGSLTQWHSIGALPELTRLETASYRIGGDISAARSEFDYVMIDCPGSATSVQEASIRASDLVISPVQPSPLDRWASSAVLQMAKAEKVPVRMLINRAPAQGADADEIRAGFSKDGVSVFSTQLGNRVGFARGFSSGRTVLSLPGQKTAKTEITSLMGEVEALLRAI